MNFNSSMNNFNNNTFNSSMNNLNSNLNNSNVNTPSMNNYNTPGMNNYNNLNINKDTRFVDLPQNIKHKLINIHKLSHQVYLKSEKLSIPSFTDLYTQIVNLNTGALQKNLNILNNNFNILSSLPSKMDMGYVETQLKNDIESLKKEVEIYNGMDSSVDFCGILETTYKMLYKKYETIINKRN